MIHRNYRESKFVPHMIVALAMGCVLLPSSARADVEFGRVTLMAGAPRMVGESIRMVQTVFSGRVIETGESDATGLMAGDVVFHIGPNSNVTVVDEPGVKRINVQRGYVVFYTDSSSRTAVVAETPFGFLTATPDMLEENGSGWFSVRHDLAQANAGPAVSTFAAMEGTSKVEGTNPQAGPHKLIGGQRWRIVQGAIPGAPEEGDERSDAENLRDRLHRETAESARSQVDNLSSLAMEDMGALGRQLPTDVINQEGQGVLDVSGANQDRLTSETAQQNPEPPVEFIPEVEVMRVFPVADPAVIPAGSPQRATGAYVSYDGIITDPNFNQYLTAVGPDPAFQPNYLTELPNGGFSYIQLAGPNAELAETGGAMFLAEEQGAASGWAVYTPSQALGDAGYDQASSLTSVVTEGLRAIAHGEHLSGGGRIGGDGVNPDTAFASAATGQVQLNSNPPPGYPQLDLSYDTTGLTAGGEPLSDQIAALGAGRNPQTLSEQGPQLLFVSSGTTDARGQPNANSFNFDGDPIEPTDLDLPGDRTVTTDSSGAPSLARPLQPDGRNTVGIQFAGTGATIAVIHHTGLRAASEEPVAQSDHFEIVRGDRFSVVQWRADQRVNGADGQPVELEDLNDSPDLRNELFTLIGREVNDLTPPDEFTIYGQAVAQPDSNLRRSLEPAQGRLVRSGTAFGRRDSAVQKGHYSVSKQALKIRPLRSASGRLFRGVPSTNNRQYVGRVRPRR